VPLIRARDAETKIAQAEVMRFQDVEAEAQRLLDDARRQAEAILADARTHGERLKADARKSGRETGLAEGLKIGQDLGRKQAYDQAIADFAARHAAVAAALAGALEQFEARRRGLQSEMERDVIALAGAIARRVIKRAVEVDPACVADNLREALQLIARRNRLEIRLHPADLEHARQFARDLLGAQDFESVGFVADETVGRSGMLLRTAGGQVDATVETQWVRILDEILAGWEEHWLLSPSALPGPDAPAEAALASGGAVVEETDPAEVEQIDPAKKEETGRNDAAE
jgi:flagellar assembly protein FliH